MAYTRVAPGAPDTAPRRRMFEVLHDELRLSEPQPLHVPMPTTPLLRAVCEILQAHPEDSRTLTQLGRQVGASERTLSRLFRKDVGMTFPQWRTQLRLHHALVLLADRTPVTTVAHRCGWSSSSAFIDVFRRTFGQTPGAYAGHAAHSVEQRPAYVT
jgi:AraC-like DNA-binding protein